MRDEQAERVQKELREIAWRVVDLQDPFIPKTTASIVDHCRQMRRSIEAIRHELAGDASDDGPVVGCPCGAETQHAASCGGAS